MENQLLVAGGWHFSTPTRGYSRGKNREGKWKIDVGREFDAPPNDPLKASDDGFLIASHTQRCAESFDGWFVCRIVALFSDTFRVGHMSIWHKSYRIDDWCARPTRAREICLNIRINSYSLLVYPGGNPINSSSAYYTDHTPWELSRPPGKGQGRELISPREPLKKRLTAGQAAPFLPADADTYRGDSQSAPVVLRQRRGSCLLGLRACWLMIPTRERTNERISLVV